MPSELGPFGIQSEKMVWSFPRQRRAVSTVKQSADPIEQTPIGYQLVNILERLEEQLKKTESPLGQRRENPFQSCLDLHDQSSSGKLIKSKMKIVRKKREILFYSIGMYWIDPNHGSSSDAIEVRCVINNGTKKTCIEPTAYTQSEQEIDVGYQREDVFVLIIHFLMIRLAMDLILK